MEKFKFNTKVRQRDTISFTVLTLHTIDNNFELHIQKMTQLKYSSCDTNNINYPFKSIKSF